MKHTGWETGEGWKSKMSVSAGWFHSEASLLGLWMATFSLSSHALYSVCTLLASLRVQVSSSFKDISQTIKPTLLVSSIL